MHTITRITAKRLMRAVAMGALAVALMAVSPAPAMADDDESIDLDYRSVAFGRSLEIQCDDSNLPILRCPFVESARILGTQLWWGTTKSSGATTIDGSGSCVRTDGQPGLPANASAENVYVAADGSELWTLSNTDFCFGDSEMVGSETAVGGTGRFAGATGTLQIIFPGGDSDWDYFQVGTITVPGDDDDWK